MGLFTRILVTLGLRKPDDELDELDELDHGSGSEPTEAETETLDDAERDPALEAEDDCAVFDFKRDIARYFTAEFRVEQAWHNPERRQQILGEYELRDGAHWYQVKATFERWLESPAGKAVYPTPAALSQARMTTTQTVTVDELEQMIEDARRAKG
jgi:hypothetical protein